MSMNPELSAAEWSNVMAEAVGNNLILGTVTTAGRALINGLNELKVEPGRSVAVPQATKPNNMYYVECLMPYERELHVDFLAAFLKNFPSAKHISMPGKKAFGTTRRIRLYFHATTAPREVFTAEDATTPIREIILPCGSAAQIIHKWQRLNQVRPPHLLNRWALNNNQRTHAVNATSPNNGVPTPTPPRSYAQAAATSTPHTPTTPTPTAGDIEMTNAEPNDPQPQPNVHTHEGQPPRTTQKTQTVTTPAPPPTSTDWTTNEPFPTRPIQPTASAPQEAAPQTRDATRNATPKILQPSRIPHPPTTNTSAIVTTKPPTATPQTHPVSETPTPTQLTMPTGTSNAARPQSLTLEQRNNQSAPDKHSTDSTQWQHVKRLRTRKPPTTLNDPPPPPPKEQLSDPH